MVSMLRKDKGGFWSTSSNDFRGCIGLVEQCKQTHDEIEADAMSLCCRDNVLSEAEAKKAHDDFMRYVDSAEAWKHGLRSGASDEVDAVIHRCVAHAFKLIIDEVWVALGRDAEGVEHPRRPGGGDFTRHA